MSSPPLRIVYLGMTGPFSMLPLAALIRSRHTVAAVLVAGNRRDTPALIPLPPTAPAGDLPLLPSFRNRTIMDLAWENGIDLYRVHDPSARHVADLVHNLGAAGSLSAQPSGLRTGRRCRHRGRSRP